MRQRDRQTETDTETQRERDREKERGNVTRISGGGHKAEKTGYQFSRCGIV